MKILAIDPSINPENCGWAKRTWAGDLDSGRMGSPTKGATIAYKCKALTWASRSLSADCDLVIIEIPPAINFAARSTRGGKALNQGSIQKLCMAIGAIIAGIDDPQKVRLVTALEWKGRAGKAVTRAISGLSNEHEADAVALLKWAIARYG